MMLQIKHPQSCVGERTYIFSVLFGKILGLQYNCEATDTNIVTIRLDDKTLQIKDDFFSIAKNTWLSPESLPLQPLKSWNTTLQPKLNIKTTTPEIPVIYGEPSISIDDNICNLGIDIFGSSFFMLTRYEEAIKVERDQHGRFPAKASLAFQEGFLTRPIINEYLEILWACFKYLWPQLERKKRSFRVLASCDVDLPYSPSSKNLYTFGKFAAANLIKRKGQSTLQMWKRYLESRHNNYEEDPFYKFEWMMDVYENAGLQGSFFFICDNSAGEVDGVYSIHEPMVRKLLRLINDRGHFIGLHGSYNSYNNLELLQREYGVLRRVCEEEGFEQGSWGGRQHFLRWETPVSFSIWDNVGLDYESTLSYADQVGFRCGICYEYPVYDVIKRISLQLKERPLIVMEATVLEKRYIGMDYDNAKKMMLSMKKTCQQFDGDFTLLWHNSNLTTEEDREVFYDVISY